MVGSEILKICAKILEVLGRRTRGGSLIVYLYSHSRLIYTRAEHRFPLIFGLFPGSFLVPDWFNLHKYIHQPEQFLLYRINGNDPLNSPKRLQNTGNIA